MFLNVRTHQKITKKKKKKKKERKKEDNKKSSKLLNDQKNGMQCVAMVFTMR